MACNAQDLMDAARCFQCLTPWQLQIVRVRLLCAIKDSQIVSCDPVVLMEQANCLMCLTPGQLDVVETSLLCQIMSSGGGGGGGGGATCGTTDPVAAPTGSCGIYYRTDNGALWAWTGSVWLQLIAP